MEKISISNDDSLLSYLDGTLSTQESKRIEEQIQQSADLKRRLEELRAIHIFLQNKNTLLNPSKNFTQRVLSNLDSFKYQQTISPKNGMLLLGGIVVAVGITLSLISSGSFDSVSTPLSLNDLPIKKEWVKNPLPTFSINAKQVMKVIMILATGLSFVLLDRTILRPLFARRSKMQL
jgi:hypothetical protein